MGARRRGARHGGRERRRCTLCLLGGPWPCRQQGMVSGCLGQPPQHRMQCSAGASGACCTHARLCRLARASPLKQTQVSYSRCMMIVGSARAEQGKCSRAAEAGGREENAAAHGRGSTARRVQGVWGRHLQQNKAALEVRALAFGIEGQGQNWREQTIAESCILGGLESEIGRDAARASRKMGQGRQQSHDEQSATKCGARRHCKKSGGVRRLLFIGRRLAGGRADDIGRWCSSHPSSVAMLATAASSWCMSWSASACCACASSSCCCSSAAAAACGGEPSPPEL